MNMPAQAHSEIGASSMYRWDACPGSVKLCRTVIKTTSGYAEEGSDAHALGAHCLRTDESPLYYINKTVDMEGRTFQIDKDMADAVDVYVEFVRALHLDTGGVLKIEQRFDLSRVHPGCFGTADAILWDENRKILHVIDYKHGAGVYVSPKENRQLLYYGLGALLQTNLPARTVKLWIVQPRCGEDAAPRDWDIDALDMLDFQAELKRAAVRTEDPNAPLKSGDHCKFCPAAAVCPQLQKEAQQLAQIEFRTDLSYDPVQLRLALDSRPALKAWLSALDEFAYAEAMNGRCPPGYKLVQKKASRKWTDIEKAAEFLERFGADVSKIYEPRELRSPTQVEKILGKGAKAHIAEYIKSESSGTTLVAESDPRLPVNPAAADEFGPVLEQE